MRVLHVVSRSQRRGAEVAAVDLVEELAALGVPGDILALARRDDGSSEPDIPVLRESTRIGVRDLVRDVWRLRRHLRRAPVDVVLAHGGSPFQVAALARRRGTPVVVWQRILGLPDSVWTRPRQAWWRWLAPRADAVVVLTDDMDAEMRRLGYRGPVRKIPNSRRPGRFVSVDRRAARTQLAVELGVGPPTGLIGFVGHLGPQKRPERAIEVLQGVRRAGADAHLVVAGAGPQRDELANAVHRAALDEHVSFLGSRVDAEKVLGAVDLLILPSDAEGVPGVAIEALMTGCPVVTFPLGEVESVVEDGVTGVVLERPDVDLMTKAVLELLGDPALRERMGSEGRHRTAERFSTRRAAERYVELFSELV